VRALFTVTKAATNEYWFAPSASLKTLLHLYVFISLIILLFGWGGHCCG